MTRADETRPPFRAATEFRLTALAGFGFRAYAEETDRPRADLRRFRGTQGKDDLEAVKFDSGCSTKNPRKGIET